VSASPRPYVKRRITLPSSPRELFFDIEHDPLRDHCYLHGLVERINGDTKSERYVAFLAETPTMDEQRRAFAEAWHFVRASEPAAIFYYSKFERTVYRKLQTRCPDVCTSADVKRMFDGSRAVDLCSDVVLSCTEWPTRDYSIKTLAKYLGFAWRDRNSSGAASIEWAHRWYATGDNAVRQRILDYNEDDCRAMRVLLDEVRVLSVST
jgi:predicted RecB family nuclease